MEGRVSQAVLLEIALVLAIMAVATVLLYHQPGRTAAQVLPEPTIVRPTPAVPPREGTAPPALPFSWLDRPATDPQARPYCPGRGQWAGLYWAGPPTPLLSALAACPDMDLLWIHLTRPPDVTCSPPSGCRANPPLSLWVGAFRDAPGASDDYLVGTGQFAFGHGAR